MVKIEKLLKMSKLEKMTKVNNTNNIFQYLVFIIALLNIGYFIMIEEYQSIISFVVIISVCSMFTKHLLLLLLFGIVGMNLFYLINFNSIENMENMENLDMDMSYNTFKSYVMNSLSSVDPAKLDRDNKEFVIYIKSNQKMEPKEYYTEFKNKYRELSDTKWVDKNVVNFKEVIIVDEVYDSSSSKSNITNTVYSNNKYDKNDKTNETFENQKKDGKETNVDSKGEIENIVNKLKETTPELSQSLDVLNKIDINEMNKLINQMNTILQSTSA
jgi:hypothetical protein